MQLSIAAALFAYTTSVYAFADSSPFIVLSTAELSTSDKTPQLQTSSQLLDSAKAVLSSCPTERYLVVSIPNLHAADIRDGSVHSLGQAVSDQKLSDFSVAEVIGQVSTAPLEEYIRTTCQTKGKQAAIEPVVELKHLPSARADAEKRKEVLADNDYELARLLDGLEGSQYTVIILSDPNEFKAYEPDFVEPLHMDLKRQSEPVALIGRRADNSTRDNRPLFEKYQFFTPGVFMGLFSLIILLSILYAGLSALSSLQVSYGAFDKDMGPAAQKKQM